MTKKKIITLALVAIIAVMAVASASLAYLKDEKGVDNTFTVGNVKIELIEKQRKIVDGEKSAKLEDLENFEQGKKLLPIVGSAQGTKDAIGLSTAKNYVDKIVTVRNLDENAYVRVYIALPAALDSVGDASKNIIHINQPGKDTFVGLDGTTAGKAFTWTDMEMVGTATIEGVLYNVYYSTYEDMLKKDETAGCAAYVGLYLDKDVSYDGENWVVTRNGETTVIDFDLSKGVTIPVYAVGVQADGFESADKAIDSAFGADFNPWNK